MIQHTNRETVPSSHARVTSLKSNSTLILVVFCTSLQDCRVQHSQSTADPLFSLATLEARHLNKTWQFLDRSKIKNFMFIISVSFTLRSLENCLLAEDCLSTSLLKCYERDNFLVGLNTNNPINLVTLDPNSNAPISI